MDTVHGTDPYGWRSSNEAHEQLANHRGFDVNAPLIVAGSLAILGTAIRGVGGEVYVVRKLSPQVLASNAIGDPRTTKLMIHVTWHLTTMAFLRG